jgi:hypothetical protein
MAILDLLDQSYLSKAPDQNQAQLINMYLEQDASKGKYKVIALPMHGLTLFCDTLQGQVRELYELNGVLYAVAGNKLYSVASNGTFTQLGPNLNTSSGFVKMRAITGGTNSNHQIIFIDGVNGYSYNVGTSTATMPIADPDFPQTAIDLENQDDYAIVVQANSMSYQISSVSDTTTWAALDFASKTGQPDNINACLSHEGKVWFFGDKTTEIWVDSGAVNFPFTRDSTTFLHYGCPSSKSIAVNGNYFLFLSSNGNGGYSVFQTQPRIYYYNPAPVSTPPIDKLIAGFSTISDAIASIYNLDGHELYTLTFPTANATIVYDIPKTVQADQSKGAWYYRQSYNNNTSSYGRFLGNCQAFCYGKNFVGDFNSGKIYYLDNTNYTENGTPILRQFVSPGGPTYNGGKRVFFNRMQIDVQTGVGNNETFTLEKSVDNGATWQLVNTYTVPPQGGRIYENRLGSSRYGMLFRITTTMNANFCLLGFQVETSTGHS